MAALCMCDEFLLFTNGRSTVFISLRFPTDVQLLAAPSFELRDAGNGTVQTTASHETQAAATDTADKEEIEKADGDLASTQVASAPECRTKRENLTLACTVSQDGRYLALCDDLKFLHVYRVSDGHCTRHFSRPVARRCTTVRFTKDSQQVIVADKSGDVYSFHVPTATGSSNLGEQHTGQARCRTTSPTAQDCAHDAQRDQAGQGCANVDSEGTLVLGHLSMLLDVLLVDDDRLIVTCDRDEKIRLSSYPDAYNIHAYCLGHLQFVRSVAFDHVQKVLLSGSGDCTIRLWNLNGEELHCTQIWQDLAGELRDGGTQSCGEAQQTTANSSGDEPGRTQPEAIQQIVYSSTCQLLFVSVYGCPHVLVYKLTHGETGQPSLQFLSILKGHHDIVSLCVHQSVLWTISQASSVLQVSAYRIHPQSDGVHFSAIIEGSSSSSIESQLLHTLAGRSDLLTAPPNSLDLLPFLWKSPHQEGFPASWDRKRQRTDLGEKEREKRQRH